MKNEKLQILAILFISVLFSNTILASKKNDVVKISLPNKTAIEIVGVNMNKYKVDTAYISENVNRFLKFCTTSNIKEIMLAQSSLFIIKKMDGNIWMDSLMHKEYPESFIKEESYQLSISERDIPDQIISSQSFNKSIYYLQKHQLQFESDYYTYKIKFDELEQLEDFNNDDIVGVIDAVMIKNYNEKSKFIEKRHYAVDEDYNYKKNYQNIKYPTDQIEISGITGIESVKNTWAANFELSMALSFKRKGIAKNSYNFYYEWQYDFSSPDKRSINQFMSIGYRRDFTKDPENSNAYTFKLGYLINKQGDLYNDDTFKFGVSRSIGKSFSIEPQIYFNNFFQNVIPSIKIGIGF